MRDGAQQRGLELVAAPQRRGLDHLALQRVALDRRAEEGLEGGHDALAAGARRTLGRAPAGTSSVPERGALAAAAGRRGARRPATARSSIAADGSSSAWARRCATRGQRLVEARAAQQQPRHLGGQVGLLAALVRLARADARALGQGAGDEGGDEEDGERDPVLALARS